jgi:hypothetical protein
MTREIEVLQDPRVWEEDPVPRFDEFIDGTAAAFPATAPPDETLVFLIREAGKRARQVAGDPTLVWLLDQAGKRVKGHRQCCSRPGRAPNER